MKNALSFFILILFLLVSGRTVGQIIKPSEKPADELEITVLYDNYSCIEGTETDWGFSCMIEVSGEKILFDAGTKPEILVKNAEVTGTELTDIDQLIISHNHHDHIGGLETVLRENKNIPVHLPYPADSKLKELVDKMESKAQSKLAPYSLAKNVWSSGTMEAGIPEQCIVVNHEKGLVVITGCSHPGIADMLGQIKSDFGKEIYAVMGGFHLMMHSRKKIDDIVESFNDLGVKKCGCTHCTGGKQIQQFREAYGDDFIEMGTGRRIVI